MRQSRAEKRAPFHRKPKIEAILATGDIEKLMKALTPRQVRFAEEYIVDFNGTYACQRAGYTTRYPSNLAVEMLAHPGIHAVIDHLILERTSKSVLKPEYVINKITKTIEKAEADNNHGAVLRGCELLARHLGMFIERTEISGPDGEAIKYERVQEAADAFTSAIAGLVERAGEDEPIIIVGPKC